MEAAPQQAGGEGQEQQKLKIDKFADGGIVCLKFAGSVDEDFDGKKLAATVKAQTLVLDLADIKKISSFGIREWVDFIHTAEKNTQDVVLLECAPKVVDQLNMVANFAGSGKVFSFYAPYRCDYCDSDSYLLMQVDRDWEVIKSMKPPERPCASCGEPEYFDEDPTTYFSFIAGQDRFELDPEVGSFLSSKLNYTVSESARKLRLDKVIEGRNTYLKIAGDLDGSFPREKLAEGLEGTLIIDVSGVGKVDPAGAAEWRGFLQMISPTAEAIYLLGVPPGFLEKLTKPEDLGPKAQVITFAMPYSCEKCATTSSQLVDVEQHYDVLKFATPPEMKCTDCKSPTVCAATEGLLSHLPTLPRPSISPQTRKFIKEVQERKPEKKKSATTVAEAAAAGRGGSMAMMFGVAALTLALAGGAFFGYRYMEDRAAQAAVAKRDAVGALLNAKTETRPAWITSDTRFSSQCSGEGGGLSCIGISSYAQSEEDAREEARAAALEALINAVGLRIDDGDWNENVRAIYSDVRAAKLDAWDKAGDDADDNRYQSSKREVLKSRKQVADSLRETGGDLVPAQPTAEHWEEYAASAGGGNRYLVFIQYKLGDDQVKRLVDKYSTMHEAAGAAAVTVFPGIAWRYPDIVTGAVIADLRDGDLRAIGVAEQYIITMIQDKVVKDAAAFARIVNEEVERLKESGGNLKLKVKTGDTPQVEFNQPIQRKVVDRPDTGGGSRGGDRTGPTRGTGPLNTWQKYDRGGNRDDPTQ
jgi:ABC-type transporter Mla MlaB component